MRYVWVAALLVCLSESAPAQKRGHPWIRRITLAASCAASFWDLQTTRAAVSQGAFEGNRFLANADGSPRWGRIIGLKAGLCGGMVLTEVLVGRKHETASIAVNSALAGLYSAAAIHNYQVMHQLADRRRAAAPQRMPAWLSPGP